MKRLFRLFLLLLAAAFINSQAMAQEVADAFRYPVTTDGLSSGSSYIYSRDYKEGVNGLGYHDGSDFDYGCDDSIYAVANGVVVESDYLVGTNDDGTTNHDEGWGNLIRIKHTLTDGSVYYSQYAHLSSRSVSNGAVVSYGDVIGYMGTTGYSTGCHLHFQIIYDDNRRGEGYYSSETGSYWDTFIDPITFLDSHLGEECSYTTQPTVSASTPPLNLVVPRTKNAIEDGEQHYDFHGYYFESSENELLDLEQCESDTDFSEEVCSPDAGNPLIDNEGSHENMEKWLTGDVTGDGYDDIVLITHVSGDFKAHVWTANGDGSFNTRVKWLEKSNQHDLYFLGDYDGDGDEDLIRANDDGNETIEWKVHKSNGSTAFASTATTWTSDFGKSVDEDIFLVGDVTGDGKVDIVRGYESSSSSDTCDTDGTVKRWWRIRASGSNDVDDFIDDGWGCASSTYKLGDVDGDNDMDLVQFRVESDDSVRVFVNTSNGSKFNNGDRWKKRFGDSDNWFYVHDINGDGNDDIIRYIKTGGKRVRAAESNGSDGFTGFAAPLFPSKMKMPKEKSNLLFGYFGDITLYDGEEDVCESNVTIQTSSLMGATNTYDDMGISDFDPIKVNGQNAIYLYLDGEKRAFGSWTAYTNCGYGAGMASYLTESEMNIIPTGDGIGVNSDTGICAALEEGDLIKHDSSNAVYLFADDQKWAFSSDTVFEACYGTNGWDDILHVPEDVVDAIPSSSTGITDEAQCGQIFDGYLIKSPDENAVYYIENGDRRAFGSSEALTGCGFSWDEIIKMPEYQINQIDLDEDNGISTSSCP